MDNAVLFGPFIGEFYWECGRFAPMLPFYKTKKYKKENPKFIIFTREERFDLYGKNADILVPLKITGDYNQFQPECFRLTYYSIDDYHNLVKKFFNKYKEKYNILEHVFPNIKKPHFVNKNQYSKHNMIFKYEPRSENYDLVNRYLPTDKKPLVVIAPRFRNGFKRNWKNWKEFYDLLYNDKKLYDNFNFIICGKRGEYVPDDKSRFLDINDIPLSNNSSLAGILLVIMERAVFVFGSQSAIPNIGLLYKVEVLEFGCQKNLHAKTYNIFNSKITFIENKLYDIKASKIFSKFRQSLIS